MKNLVFIEDFSNKHHLPESDIVALNVRSHYELLKRGINHYTISDLVDFESYLAHSEDYNSHQKLFFEYCDKNYNHIKINNGIEFCPFKILGYDFKLIFDSLYAQSIIICEIIKKFKPQKVILYSPYKSVNAQIDYLKREKSISYDFLYFEIIRDLSTVYKYDFENITISKCFRRKTNLIKDKTKEKIKNYKYYNIFRQSLLYKGKYIGEMEAYDIFKGTKNLFINQGWGLDKLIKYSLVTNSKTIVLKDNFLFIYRNLKIKNCVPLHINDGQSDVLLPNSIEIQTKYYEDFVNETLGISLYRLIYNRMQFINIFVIPNLLNGCILVEKMLREYNVEKVIGNMRISTSKNFSKNMLFHILPFLSTYDSNYSYFHFTHGYDPYVIDRTFLELPCNYYITLNEEYKRYFINSFKDQNFFKVPKVEVLEL